VLITALSLFTYVSWLNLPYYKIERIGYADIAKKPGADRLWPYLQAGVRYCAVGVAPFGMVLTGPTMSEYYIIDRSQENLCPENTVHIGSRNTKTPFDQMMGEAVDLIYGEGDYTQAIELLNRVLQIAPRHYGALWQRAVALTRSGQTEEAIEAWETVVYEARVNGYSDLAEAYHRLTRLKKPE